MRRAILVMTAILACCATELHAQHGLPSQAELAAMGLADIEIMSDDQASQIRVRGFRPNRWGNLYSFVYGISRLEPNRPIRPINRVR